MHNLLIRFEIPIQAAPIVGTPSLVFTHWAPLEEKDFFLVTEEGLTLKLWFDRTCLGHVGQIEDLSRQVNVLIDKVRADITLQQVDDELGSIIQEMAQNRKVVDAIRRQKYEEMGTRVLKLCLTYFNRLVSYARIERGQYWLQEYPMDFDSLYRFSRLFQAKVFLGSNWVSWVPSQQQVIRLRGQHHEEARFIDQNAWLQAMDFMRSSHRTSLVYQLLAGAEMLEGSRHRRSALTEAVTALEVAIAEFARNPTFNTNVSGRINMRPLKDWVNRLGLSGTVHYFFPIIFSEDQIPTKVLKDCQEAVEVRQNVVHNGQRDIDEEALRRFLFAIRSMCSFLRANTASLMPVVTSD